MPKACPSYLRCQMKIAGHAICPSAISVDRACTVASQHKSALHLEKGSPMQESELLEFLLDTFAELATLHAAAATTAERAWSKLINCSEDEVQDVLCGEPPYRCSQQHPITVDATTFTVAWQGQRCYLGPTIQFRLIQHLARRPGRYLTYDILMQQVWHRCCSNATVRSAVKRLRQGLRAANMPDLAAAIKAQRGCYGLFLG